MKNVGTSVYGIRLPIISKNDNLVEIIMDNLELSEIEDDDIIGVTESIVARAENNYVDLETISYDVRDKIGNGPIGLIFPIFSRNRFMPILKAIAGGVDELILQLSFPCDEVGNELFSDMELFKRPHVDLQYSEFNEEDFKKEFGKNLSHPITKINYVKLYKSLNSNIKVIFSNNPVTILQYTKRVICGNIHERNTTKKTLLNAGAEKVLTLAEIMNRPINGSGFNTEYGLLGSNYSTQYELKLFPENGKKFVDDLYKRIFKETEKKTHVLIYGDGAYKDPSTKIWELADPVVSPAYTVRLEKTPREIKLKQVRDEYNFSSPEEVKDFIKRNKASIVGDLGTTPRKYVDLIGSLCDLVSGSGDKGTPVIYIKNYFTNYSEE